MAADGERLIGCEFEVIDDAGEIVVGVQQGSVVQRIEKTSSPSLPWISLKVIRAERPGSMRNRNWYQASRGKHVISPPLDRDLDHGAPETATGKAGKMQQCLKRRFHWAIIPSLVFLALIQLPSVDNIPRWS
jgi:hypothetical protein